MSEIEMAPLSIEDFSGFFHGVHGNLPFPWQERLLRRVAENGWPEVLDLPTGSGKTAALDVAVFHLALEAANRAERKAPVRIAFVVDRRLVVDDAYERAKKIAAALENPAKDSFVASVAAHLRLLAGEGEKPLLARRLRGGLPREDSWARTPAQPVILCSTVDQIGSRLLFRGYGVSDSMKPVHAGLIGSDCLILLDEAHLSEPFRQTLEWVAQYKGAKWREEGTSAPWNVVTLSATPGKQGERGEPFGLNQQDRENEILKRRLHAPKKANLIPLAKGKRVQKELEADGNTSDKQLVNTLVDRAQKGLDKLKETIATPALAVAVNRVQRARAVFDELQKQLAGKAEIILLIGPSRPVDREELTAKLDPIHTGHKRNLERPLIIVATQCIEAGVDIDLDGLITEAAPLNALRQRFGRLNRDGRPIEPVAAIVEPVKLKKGNGDPVYGDAIQTTWEYLNRRAEKPVKKTDAPRVDFGLTAFEKLTADSPIDSNLLSPNDDAPVLMPAHLDLLAQTSPISAADPEVSLYLHGPKRSADSVAVIWRADIDPAIDTDSARTRRLLTLMPPRSAEAIELPVWAVRQWLTTKTGLDTLADVPAIEEDEGLHRQRPNGKRVFLWAGNEDTSQWIIPQRIRPGSTIVVPASYGGVDKYGWNPGSTALVSDVAEKAAKPMHGSHYAVRVAPGLLGKDSEHEEETLAVALHAHDGEGWKDLRDAVLGTVLSTEIRRALKDLDHANGKGRDKVQVDMDCYGRDEQNRPRGIVFFAPRGLNNALLQSDESIATTEDDFVGTLAGYNLSLEDHSKQVADKAKDSATCAGLPPDRIEDLRIAGLLHDAGKADARFQSLLAYYDPLGPDPKQVLAKSARRAPSVAYESAALPKHWRHEALSVRLATGKTEFEQAADKELVLWLIGTHHGHGRPFFPHEDPIEQPPKVGPQSLAYEWNGLDWFSLFERLKARYGLWELARLEAILRLADHRASEEAAAQSEKEA